MLEGDFHPSDVVHSQAHGARASRLMALRFRTLTS